MVRLTDRPDMTLDVYRGRKTTMQHSREGKNLSHSQINTICVILPGEGAPLMLSNLSTKGENSCTLLFRI